MRLNAYTDYALRILIFLDMSRERLVTVQGVAEAHGIANNHLTKVFQRLRTLGDVVKEARKRHTRAAASKYDPLQSVVMHLQRPRKSA